MLSFFFDGVPDPIASTEVISGDSLSSQYSSADSTMIASIGPVTSAVIEENGYNVDIEAETQDIPGLVSAVEALAERLQ